MSRYDYEDEWEWEEVASREIRFARIQSTLIVVLVLGAIGFGLFTLWDKVLNKSTAVAPPALTTETQLVETTLPEEVFVGPQLSEEESKPTLKETIKERTKGALKEGAKEGAKEAWYKFWE